MPLNRPRPWATHQRLGAGLDSRVQDTQAAAALPDMRAQIEALQEQAVLTRRQLAVLAGQPPDALRALAPRLAALTLQTPPQALGADLADCYAIGDSPNDLEMLEKISKKLEKNKKLAVASSFKTNLEITAVEAQKGPVLKQYIESLGYTMDEVMVLGDSLNDYSMISMDFGATVAMENAVPEIKRAAKYITKNNNEFGVAYAIDQVLERQGK